MWLERVKFTEYDPAETLVEERQTGAASNTGRGVPDVTYWHDQRQSLTLQRHQQYTRIKACSSVQAEQLLT